MKTKQLFPLVLLLFSIAARPEISTCPPSGVSIGFFNGVNNTKEAAELSLKKIKELRGDTYKSPSKPDQAIHYDLYYNETQGIFSDVAETIAQRLEEKSAQFNGQIDKDLNQFWLTRWHERHGYSAHTIGPGANDRTPPEYEFTPTEMIKGLDDLRKYSVTLADHQNHRNIIDTRLAPGEKLILIADSQGNLFMNEAYDYAIKKAGVNAVKAIHIAPPTTIRKGEYTLAEIDTVIGGLSLLLPVPLPNTFMLPNKNDPTGHELVATYLDTNRSAYERILKHLDTALKELTPPPTVGLFTVSATWKEFGNIELFVREPDGVNVSPRSPVGKNGSFVATSNTGDQSEIYASSCNAMQLTEGIYDIGINNDRAPANTQATVQVSTPTQGVLLTRRIDTGPARGLTGNDAPWGVMSVNVKKTSDNVEISAN